MPIYNRIAKGVEEVDVIIVGGGTAGCVLAGRLAAADPKLEVLVIEGGEDNYQKDNVVNPALFREHLAPTSRTAVFYKSTKQPQLAGREVVIPTGGMLGGGSSINVALYSRPYAADLDSWMTVGWGADDLLPFLRKFETYHGRGRKELHGQDGPIQVSDGGFTIERAQADFIEAAKAVGYPDVPDLQDLRTGNGVERAMRWISPDGKRQDAAHSFLHPHLQDGKHPNLHVLCQSKVIRVVFDGENKATGVEYTPNPEYQVELNLTMRPNMVVRARKMVVLSAGACGTPAVLERSGVGDAEVLERANVKLVANVPGVGQDYQDHHLIFYPFRTNLNPDETVDTLFDGTTERSDAITNRNPLLGWNACDVHAKIRPTDKEVNALGENFQEAWERDFASTPDRPVMCLAAVSSYVGDHATIERGQYMSIAAYTAYPYSRGKLHITGPNWDDPMNFDLGFFTDPQDIDLKKHIWAYKKQREIMRRTHMYRGELESGHPQFPKDSKAACVNAKHIGDTNGSGPANNLRDIEYSAEDDEAIVRWLRENIQTTWHSLGTAKMAPFEQKGVVDKDLNVYGVTGLKCCDLSIAPKNVAANTMATALLIGEKGADIVLKELGLPPADNKLFKH